MNSTKYMKLLAVGLIILSFSSCYQDVIDIDFNEVNEKIVIEGIITDQLDRHTVRINRTSTYSRPDYYPVVQGARVVIYDNEGITEVLNEDEPGIYRTSQMRGIPGKTYTLEVVINNEIFTASSYLSAPIQIDSVKLVSVSGYPQTMEPKLYFHDPVGSEEYFRARVISNYNYPSKYDEVLYNGSYYEGKYIIIDDFWRYSTTEESLAMEIASFDHTTFQMYYMMQQRKERDNDNNGDINASSILEASDFNFSNFSNHAIGMFSAQSIRKYILCSPKSLFRNKSAK